MPIIEDFVGLEVNLRIGLSHDLRILNASNWEKTVFWEVYLEMLYKVQNTEERAILISQTIFRCQYLINKYILTYKTKDNSFH